MQENFRLITAPNGVTYLSCVPLGAPHGFSTRLGGESLEAYASLDLGGSVAEDPATVVRNRAAWAVALGFDRAIAGLHQIHGADVHLIRERPDQAPRGDAWVSDRPGLPIGIYTADCTPILLNDPVVGVVGAVHAGWRGTVAQIVMETVTQLVALGARPARLRAAIGPTIGPCCFEVGAEVVAAFAERPWPGSDTIVAGPTAAGRPTIDLFAANRTQLLAAGLAPENVHVSGLCTFCRADLFYSWRRDNGRTGRMQAAIASAGATQ